MSYYVNTVCMSNSIYIAFHVVLPSQLLGTFVEHLRYWYWGMIDDIQCAP